MNNGYNYQQIEFYTTVNDLECLPREPLQEIAIVGRSNCGKSSLLNALTNKKRLAFTSKTPGRTQHINYFKLTVDKFLVDLPGYGYAKVPAAISLHWQKLLTIYLQTRQQLTALILIMDSRHPLKELDYQMLRFFAVRNLPIHIVLSKIDKLTHIQSQTVLKFVTEQLSLNNFAYSIQTFSAKTSFGVNQLRQSIDQLFLI